MTITFEAIYENGVLKPREPLPLKEFDKVQVTIRTEPSSLLAGYGMMGFTGTIDEAGYFASDPELDAPLREEA